MGLYYWKVRHLSSWETTAKYSAAKASSILFVTELQMTRVYKVTMLCAATARRGARRPPLLLSQKSSWLTPESIFEKLLATLARLLILCLQIEQSVESVVNNIGEDWMEPLSWLLYCLLEPLSSPRLYWDINNLRRSSMAASEQPLPTSKADHLWSFPPIFCLKTLLIFCFWFDLDLFRFSIFE